MRSGFIAIIGRPNAGKSTLLNALLKEKIAITTEKAQTTRNAILGIYNEDDTQIVFIDTPGIHEAKTALGSYMNREALSQAEGVDIIYYIVDGNKGIRKEDQAIIRQVFRYEVPVFLLLNKIDELSSEQLIERLNYASANFEFAEIVPLSALSGENIEELLKVSRTYLKDDVVYFPTDMKTDRRIDFQIAEIIREKIILCLQDEVPHLVAVKVEEIRERTSKVFIEATIICNKDTHKGIIIGRKGAMLKRINELSSSDIARLFDGRKIILSLYVRVEEDWLNSQKQLFELGYFSGDSHE